MPKTVCDITYADSSNAGACSDHFIEVYHGMTDPAIVCARHAASPIPQAVFTGHRERVRLEGGTDA